MLRNVLHLCIDWPWGIEHTHTLVERVHAHQLNTLVELTHTWVLGIGYWVLGIGYWVLCFVYRVSGIGYRVSDIGYWVLGNTVLGIGYWVLGRVG